MSAHVCACIHMWNLRTCESTRSRDVPQRCWYTGLCVYVHTDIYMFVLVDWHERNRQHHLAVQSFSHQKQLLMCSSLMCLSINVATLCPEFSRESETYQQPWLKALRHWWSKARWPHSAAPAQCALGRRSAVGFGRFVFWPEAVELRTEGQFQGIAGCDSVAREWGLQSRRIVRNISWEEGLF